ncbi:MAG: Ig-like domain-containing protein [Pseudomonadota bacterium]
MKQHYVLWLVITCIFCTAWEAQAEYWGMVNPPDWSAEPGYTRQSWSFSVQPVWQEEDSDSDGDSDAYVVDGAGYAADHAMENPYGQAVFFRTDFGDSFAWDWSDEGPMEQDWPGVQGMIGGMGQGTIDFRIPAAAGSGDKEIWLQYVVYIPNGLDGSAVGARPASDESFGTVVGTQTDKTWEQIHDLDAAGGTGEWWRITEKWELSGTNAEFFRIHIDAAGTSNIIDSFDCLMRSINIIPEPAPQTDTTPPAVTTTLPDNASVDIALDTVIRITFSEQMDTASVQSAFSIEPAVTGAMSWTEQDTILAFTPDTSLAAGTDYTVLISEEALDLSGNRMSQVLTFGFSITDVQSAGVDNNQGGGSDDGGGCFVAGLAQNRRPCIPGRIGKWK